MSKNAKMAIISHKYLFIPNLGTSLKCQNCPKIYFWGLHYAKGPGSTIFSVLKRCSKISKMVRKWRLAILLLADFCAFFNFWTLAQIVRMVICTWRTRFFLHSRGLKSEVWDTFRHFDEVPKMREKWSVDKMT